MEDEQMYSCNSKLSLDNFTAEQGLKAEFIDFEELSRTGKYQTSLQVFTPFTLAFHGESTISYEEAQQDAAYNICIVHCTVYTMNYKYHFLEDNINEMSGFLLLQSRTLSHYQLSLIDIVFRSMQLLHFYPIIIETGIMLNMHLKFLILKLTIVTSYNLNNMFYVGGKRRYSRFVFRSFSPFHVPRQRHFSLLISI
ncbi:hypothetical protein AGLY_006786 [Aphis glycines]|uniref:DRBM domain-containing protein n=1 Tax=Aphis glycines TaxID=307491 RepID=A0A6G0TQF7_APHGL|nr:hypothetical protein AGLY_006786 [Aphis glycines]